MSYSSSNMVATPTSAYGILPAQSDTIAWMSFLRQFKAQASADGILACFEGDYKIEAKPTLKDDADYPVLLERYNAQVDKRTKDHSFAYLILTKLCDKLSFIIMDHEGKRLTGNNNRVSETYKQLLEWYGTGRSNATTQILDELERTKVIETSDSVTDYATFKSKLDQMFSQLEFWDLGSLTK